MTNLTTHGFRQALILAQCSVYPVFFITANNTVLSLDSAIECQNEIVNAIEQEDNNGWLVTHMEINWEDEYLYCDHSGQLIESAY